MSLHDIADLLAPLYADAQDAFLTDHFSEFAPIQEHPAEHGPMLGHWAGTLDIDGQMVDVYD